MSETLQSDKRVDENKKQKESENKSKHITNAENNELQNQILDTSNSINSESKSAPNIRDNIKIDENIDKLEYKENDIVNNEASLQSIEKSGQSISEAQMFQSENNDARYRSRHLILCYEKLIFVIFNDNLIKYFQHSTIKF